MYGSKAVDKASEGVGSMVGRGATVGAVVSASSVGMGLIVGAAAVAEMVGAMVVAPAAVGKFVPAMVGVRVASVGIMVGEGVAREESWAEHALFSSNSNNHSSRRRVKVHTCVIMVPRHPSQEQPEADFDRTKGIVYSGDSGYAACCLLDVLTKYVFSLALAVEARGSSRSNCKYIVVHEPPVRNSCQQDHPMVMMLPAIGLAQDSSCNEYRCD